MSLRPSGHATRVGIFVKTAAPQTIEVLGLCGMDFAVVDAEHAPIDIAQLDVLMLAGRAADLALHVRVPDWQPSTLLRVLDLGAAGVLVPHVDSAHDASAVVRACRYHQGTRGYSGSTRFAGYGTTMMRDTLNAAEQISIMCQIESVASVSAAAEIAATPGVSGIFVGRADLALSMGLDNPHAPEVLAATAHVIQAGLAQGKIVGVLVNSRAEREDYAQQGVSWFIHGSDQALLMQAVREVLIGKS